MNCNEKIKTSESIIRKHEITNFSIDDYIQSQKKFLCPHNSLKIRFFPIRLHLIQKNMVIKLYIFILFLDDGIAC